MILVEVCFVLEFHDYKMDRESIAEALLALTTSPQIFVTEATIQTLNVYKKIISLIMQSACFCVSGGKKGVYTFDKRLAKTFLEQ